MKKTHSLSTFINKMEEQQLYPQPRKLEKVQ